VFDGTPLESCALLTTSANAQIAELHARMPAILAPESYAHGSTPRSAVDAFPDLLATPSFALRPVARA
jgi:putative SOS response-associated peptidase YedK